MADDVPHSFHSIRTWIYKLTESFLKNRLDWVVVGCSAMKRDLRKDLMGHSMLRQSIALTTTEPPKGISATSFIIFPVGQGGF